MVFFTEQYPEIKTAQGILRGMTATGNSKMLYKFYGIPYAEAPVGELRWKDAQEKKPWQGVYDCTAPLAEQKSAYQWGTDLLACFKTLNTSEDCLYLNITTPSLSPEENLPVIVWFHGGGLFGGSGSEEIYNLPYLPERGCVLVTVTTRLGAFGLLSADLLGSTEGTANAGNFMISDMLAALQWVQKNIHQVGGAPENVTIAGESGGASKVHALMTVPAAKGLFRNAIMQSGTASAMSFTDAKKAGNMLIEQTGCRTAAEARSLPAEKIVEAYNSLELMADFIVDGYFLPSTPLDAVVSGQYHPCNVIMGVNTGETNNLLMLMGGIPKYVQILNKLAQDGYTPYAYALNQVPYTWQPLHFKCVHSMDLAYLFGEYEHTHQFYNGGPWEQQFMFHDAGERLNPDHFIAPIMDNADRRLSDLIMELWISFATTGTPSSSDINWTSWIPADGNYMLLTAMNGITSHIENNFSRL